MMEFSHDEFISLVIHQTDLKLTSCVKSLLAPFDVTPEQNLVLMEVHKRGGLTQNEIAERLKKDKTNIARMVCQLEQKGFIHRQVDPVDRRSLNVHLTSRGEELRNQTRLVAEDFTQAICSGLTKEQLEQFRMVLATLCDNAHAAVLVSTDKSE
ncbi:DNA-binding MarR family transcriptional regulator [Paenibacillus phyllosphaerae]|uniref:DNA-binding MarR family transcriptional regulator n=1 Tax=Paenibacillus phyllosphaerae TaxID=274593 RepID=A0A7W5FL50_9BACL|nr:MarR family transcriptional regulator [Paenibacillus phyllosphaerae]MBB3108806.1 DNA-binding MarR family transcriptional regulator [Paenibacillus phyllosphaerae]